MAELLVLQKMQAVFPTVFFCGTLILFKLCKIY